MEVELNAATETQRRRRGARTPNLCDVQTLTQDGSSHIQQPKQRGETPLVVVVLASSRLRWSFIGSGQMFTGWPHAAGTTYSLWTPFQRIQAPELTFPEEERSKRGT